MEKGVGGQICVSAGRGEGQVLMRVLLRGLIHHPVQGYFQCVSGYGKRLKTNQVNLRDLN